MYLFSMHLLFFIISICLCVLPHSLQHVGHVVRQAPAVSILLPGFARPWGLPSTLLRSCRAALFYQSPLFPLIPFTATVSARQTLLVAFLCALVRAFVPPLVAGFSLLGFICPFRPLLPSPNPTFVLSFWTIKWRTPKIGKEKEKCRCTSPCLWRRSSLSPGKSLLKSKGVPWVWVGTLLISALDPFILCSALQFATYASSLPACPALACLWLDGRQIASTSFVLM